MGWTALLDENDNEVGIVGDEGWDLASEFVNEFLDLYKRKFNRIATMQEIISSIEFVYGVEKYFVEERGNTE